jgi:hypothetical protein
MFVQFIEVRKPHAHLAPSLEQYLIQRQRQEVQREPNVQRSGSSLRYRTGRTTTTAQPDSSGGATMAQPESAPAAADPGPYAGWNSRLRAAIDEEREQQILFQRRLLAEIVAAERRRLKLMRDEIEAKINMRAAEVAAELVMRTSELNVQVLAMKADLCQRMENTIGEMRRVLAAAEQRAAGEGPKILN